MAETATPETTKEIPGAGGAAVTPPVPRRPSGHRGADVRDTVAEMAARAQEISLEAGSKIAAAMKDVINAAAGVTGFATESARDLVQYMIRRGQMTQDEGEKLLREAEEANSKRPASSRVARPDAARPAETPVRAAPIAASASTTSVPVAPKEPSVKPTPRPVSKAKQVQSKPSASRAVKPVAKKPPAKKSASNPPRKAETRPASKSKAAPPRPKSKAKPTQAKKKKR